MPDARVRSAPSAHRASPRAYFNSGLGRLLRRTPTPPETAPGERVYAIGDIHGRLDLLQRLISTLEADAGGAASAIRIVFLGDLVDRGPQSRQVLERIRLLQSRDPARIVALAGNHEDLLLSSARGDAAAQAVWLRNGGDATLRSFGLDPADFARLCSIERGLLLRQALGADMLGWLEALPLTWRSGDYFFCHAGVRPGVALKHQRREDLLWIRHAFLDSTRAHGAVIVHGHSEIDEAEIAPNRINVDTAAHRSGELTAVGLQGPCRWMLSTAKRYLCRDDLEAALAWNGGRRDVMATGETRPPPRNRGLWRRAARGRLATSSERTINRRV